MKSLYIVTYIIFSKSDCPVIFKVQSHYIKSLYFALLASAGTGKNKCSKFLDTVTLYV